MIVVIPRYRLFINLQTVGGVHRLGFHARTSLCFSSPELHPDIESTVLCGGVQSGEKETFEQLRTLALDEHIPGTDHTAAYLSALSCTNDEDLLTWQVNVNKYFNP